MAQGIQAPTALQNFFNANSGLTSLFNRTSNTNNNSSPLSFLTGKKGLSSQTGLSALRQPNILKNLQDKTGSAANDEKKDKLDLSTFAKDAADEAIKQARSKPELGSTNQITVSQDGRFEASVDLRLNSDGSFALDLAVRFGQSSAVGIQSYTANTAGQQQQIQDQSEIADQQQKIQDQNGQQVDGQEQSAPEDGQGGQTDNYSLNGIPADLSLSSFDAIAARQTSFEQVLSTRDFQASIYFEESKAVALNAQQAQGDAVAGQYLGVSKQLAQEFTLNISISGNDLSNFNAIAEELSQFDDTGTLGSFLQAAQGVLNSDPTNASSFISATQSLVSSARDHVGAQLNNFFTGLGDAFGEELDSLGLGFNSGFFDNIGEDVNNDLNKFFDVTNQLFSNFGIDTSTDPETLTTNLLSKNLEQLREQQKAKLDEAQNEVDLSAPRNDALLTPEPQAVGVDVLG